jgi:hypothetical protein
MYDWWQALYPSRMPSIVVPCQEAATLALADAHRQILAVLRTVGVGPSYCGQILLADLSTL